MRRFFKKYAVLSALLLVGSCDRQVARMDLYVLPWYNSDPLTIDVGAYSDELRSDDAPKMLQTAEKIRAEIDRTSIPTLYVLAIRLHDLGQQEEALYWFYTARFRTRIYNDMLTDKGKIGDAALETRQALVAFSKLGGATIDRYAQSRIDLFAGILARVADEGRRMGPIAEAYPNYRFLDPSQQQAIAEGEALELQKLRTYVLENRTEIEAAATKSRNKKQ